MVLAGLTVLVDPWLEGDLTFAEQAWLYTGKKGRLADVSLNLKDIEAQTDVILLSQVSSANVLHTNIGEGHSMDLNCVSAGPLLVQGLHLMWTCQSCLAGLPVQVLARPLQV